MILGGTDQSSVIRIRCQHLNQTLQDQLQTVYPLNHQFLYLIHLLIFLFHQLVHVKPVPLI